MSTNLNKLYLYNEEKQVSCFVVWVTSLCLFALKFWDALNPQYDGSLYQIA